MLWVVVIIWLTYEFFGESIKELIMAITEYIRKN